MKKKMIGWSAALLLTASIGYSSNSLLSKQDGIALEDTKELVVKVKEEGKFERLLKSLNGKVTSELPLIQSYVVEVPEQGVKTIEESTSVLKVSETHEIETSKFKIGQENIYGKAIGQQNTHRELIEANSVSQTGKGVTVAVLDSGVGQTSSSIGNLNVIHSVTINPEATTTDDLYGHGTHVAGIISGNGIGSGIAPDAKIINVKLGDDNGGLSEIDLLLGLQWVYDHKDEYNIKVVNLSVSSTIAQSYLDSPISAAVEQLWLNGVTVVTAAGNSLTDQANVNFAPANDPFVITVGALDGQGQSSINSLKLADWSKRGRTMEGINKPELNAPGVQIASYLPSETAELAVSHPQSVYNKKYMEMSGTSMAAPVVTGAIALMLEANPNLTPNQIKYILTKYSETTSGASIINVRKAISVAKNKKELAAIAPTYNMHIPSTYLSITSNTIDFSKVSWRSIDWLKVSWRSVDWAKVSWRSYWEELGQ